MIIKFAIIAAILVGGSLLFSEEILSLVPNSSTIKTEVKDNLNDIKDTSVETVGASVNGTIDTVSSKVGEIKEGSEDFITENLPK